MKDAARNMVSRAVLALINDAAKLQRVQIAMRADEERGEVERFQDYGFTSVPFPGAEAVALSVGGSRSHMVVIAVEDRRYRLTSLEQGEVAIYTDEGDKIVLKRGREIEVTAGTRVIIDTPDTRIKGNLHVEQNITCDQNVSDMKGSMEEMRGVYNSHDHTETGGTTNTPNQEMS
ncbi:MAG TPA: phage baseplate assembly protein V [Xanthomonadaceae bacterium]